MRLDIRYRTTFTYDGPVTESQNELRACPVSDDRQQLLAYRVTTGPVARVFGFTDYWGTRVDHFGIRQPHMALEVIAEAAVETSQAPLITTAPRMIELADPDFRDNHLEYLTNFRHTACGPELGDLAREQLAIAGDDVVSAILAIHRFCGNRLDYQQVSHIGISIDELLSLGAGVCQDYAHLAVSMCRALGIPARYVSGYLFTADDRSGEDVDGDVVHVQTHAWMEAAVPGGGWMALDPTNRQRVGPRHVKIGHGRDYDDVQPFRGVFHGSVTPTLEASVEIRRMEPTRQPTTAVQPRIPLPVETQQLRQAQQQQQQQ